jgi:hypothetical protein
VQRFGAGWKAGRKYILEACYQVRIEGENAGGLTIAIYRAVGARLLAVAFNFLAPALVAGCCQYCTASIATVERTMHELPAFASASALWRTCVAGPRHHR